MNNKHKLKKIKWGMILTICLIGIIFLNTDAKSLNQSKTKASKMANKCTVLTNTQLDVKFNNSYIDMDDFALLAIRIKNNTTYDGAKFWVYTYTKDSSGNIHNEMDNWPMIYKNTTDPSATPPRLLRTTYPVNGVYVVAVYAGGVKGEGKDYCKINISKEQADRIAYNYVLHSSFEYDAEEIRNNNWVAVGMSEFENNYEDKPIAENVSYSKELQEKIKQAQQIQNKGKISKSSGYDTLPEGEIVENTNIGDLFCDKNTVYKKGQPYYLNENRKTYTYSKTTNENNCKKTCKETITVEYGPPVATKAGLCFEYKVKVQSKVACQTEWNGGDIPEPSKLCTVFPLCNNSEAHFDQAGPDEEFDQCVNKCDGGKYSQKCINKCYKEVYESSTNKKITYDTITENTNTEFLANVQRMQNLPGLNLTINDSFCNGTSAADNNYQNYNNLVNAMRNSSSDNGCKYEYKDGKITWSCAPEKSDSKQLWKSLGRYYFLNDEKAKQTINSISMDCLGEPRNSGNYFYFIDSQGFKRAWTEPFINNQKKKSEINFSEYKSCTQPCTWEVVEGNENIGKTCMLNMSDVEKDYKEKLDKYITARNACLAEASCSEESAEFTISVDNKVITKYDGTTPKEIKDKKTSFAASINNKNITDVRTISPIIDSGGCYGDKDGDYDYMTEWSFPGSWRNNKNGNVSQTEPANTNGWSQKEYNYCTPLNSGNVNANWWKWAQYEKLASKDSYANSNLKYNGTISDYNITASTKKFGYFGWNINMKCFYAIFASGNCVGDNCDGNDGSNTPKPPCSGSNCSTSDDEPKSPTDYEVRSVDTKELFPESRTSEDSSGRKTTTIGFNWTAKANENLGDKSYEIKPEELKENIQKQTDDGTKYSNENLEYSFKLTRSNLNSLKKAKDNLTDFGNDFEEYKIGKEGLKSYTIYAYHSKIIRDTTYVSEHDIKRTKFCNNWDNGRCRTYS